MVDVSVEAGVVTGVLTTENRLLVMGKGTSAELSMAKELKLEIGIPIRGGEVNEVSIIRDGVTGESMGGGRELGE